MSDFVDRMRKELDARIEQLRPLVREFERLEGAAAALARAGATAVPGLGASRPAPAAARPGAEPTGRATRARPPGAAPPLNVGPPRRGARLCPPTPNRGADPLIARRARSRPGASLGLRRPGARPRHAVRRRRRYWRRCAQRRAARRRR